MLKSKNILTKIAVLYLTIIGVMSVLCEPVSALANPSSGVTLVEIETGGGYWKNGKLGNGKYYLGQGYTGTYPDSVLVNSRTNEYLMCLEPGIATNNGGVYGTGNIDSVFQYIQNYSGSKTTVDVKKRLVGRLLTFFDNNTRYDTGTAAEKIDKRIRSSVINILIWEVMLEERDASFNYIGAKSGCVGINTLWHYYDQNWINRYNQIRSEIVYIMQRYTKIPTGTYSSADLAKTIVLDKYDTAKGEYYTELTDTTGILKYYSYSSSASSITVTNTGTKLRIASKSGYTSGLISGYNTKIRGNGNDISSIMQVHTRGSDQIVATPYKISDPNKNSYIRVRTLPDNGVSSTLTVNPNGGSWSGSTSTQSFTQKAGTTKTIANPTRTGYTFTGWTVTGKGIMDGKTKSISTTTPGVLYLGHISYVGWHNWKSSGSSISDSSNYLEAVQILLGNGLNKNFDIQYRAHVEWVGWQGWVKDGATAGTVGENQAIQAIEMKLTGVLANYYNIEYRACVEGTWQGWVSNGATAGTTGQSKNMTNLQIRLVKKVSSSSSANNKFYFLDSNATLTANWTPNTYTNTIDHWMFGFTKGEGNNSGKNAWKIGSSSFSQTYGTTFTMGSSRAKTVPNGFYLDSNFGSSSISGTWKTYPLNTIVTQKASSMHFEYDYRPKTYTITYNMNGGTNSKNNPSSYNVLYGFTLSAPTRTGYTFTGWTINGVKVTGVNQGKSNNWASADAMYADLAKRTTGNLTIVANWINNEPVIDEPVIDYNPDDPNDPNIPEGTSGIPPFINGNSVVVQKGDPVNPLDFVTANDVEDGDLTDKVIIVEDNIPRDADGNTTKAGTYEVTVSVTDDGGATTTGEVTIIVNDPPVISSQDRWFFIGEPVDSAVMKEKAEATDKEDGDIKKSIVITYVKDMEGNNLAIDKIDTSKAAKYVVGYKVTDKYKASSECEAIFNVVENSVEVEDWNIRYISKDFINTLDADSKWKTNAQLFAELNASLNKAATDENALYVFEFGAEETEEMKEFYLNNAHDENMNSTFMETFSDIFIKRPSDGNTKMK